MDDVGLGDVSLGEVAKDPDEPCVPLPGVNVSV